MIDTSIEVGIEGIEFFLGQINSTNVNLSSENPDWDFDKIIERSGVYSRPLAEKGLTALDLGYQAAINLVESLHTNLTDIDALIFLVSLSCPAIPHIMTNSSRIHNPSELVLLIK